MEPVLASMIHRGIPAPQRSTWQRFLAPMLLASLGLHGLVLLVPTGASQEDVIPPADPEQDSVAITRVPPEAPAPDTPLTNGNAAASAAPGQPLPGPTPILRATLPAQRSAVGSVVGSANSGLSRRAVTSPANNAPSRQSQSVQQGANASSHRSSGGDNSASPNNASPRANPASSPPASASTAMRPTSPAPSPSSPTTRPPSPSSAAHSQPLSGSDLRAQLQAYAADLNLPQIQIDRLADSLRQRFSYDAVASTDEAFAINQAQWQSQIRQETTIADLTAETLPDSVPLVYRQRVCWAQAPGPVKVGLVIRPDGFPQGEPAVLQSSGYGAVDEQALKALTEKAFPAAATTKAYILTVEPDLDYGRRPCINPNPEA